MKKIEVTGCGYCVFRQDHCLMPGTSCMAVRSKRHPHGRDFDIDVDPLDGPEHKRQSWCPLESGDILITLKEKA